MTDSHSDSPSGEQPDPIRPPSPTAARPVAFEPPRMRPPSPDPPSAPAPRPVLRPLFPPAAAGLFPTPADPLVSADFNGWWQRSFRLLGAIWRHAALVQLLWLVPMVLAGTVAGFFVTGVFTDLAETPPGVQPDWQPFLRSLYYLVPIGVLSGLLFLLASTATLHLVVQAALGRPLSIELALRTAGARLPAYLGWGLLGGLLTLAGFVCCLLPGYYVAVVLNMLATVVLLERGNAIRRCFRLFHARPGDALGRLGTMIGLGMAISIAEQLVLGLLGAVFGLFSADGIAPAGFVVIAALTLVFASASQVALAPMHVTTYADMRARYEPFSTAYLH